MSGPADKGEGRVVPLPGTELPLSAQQYTGLADNWFVRDAAGALIAGRGSRLTKEHAAYIVRACNAFHELVEAIEITITAVEKGNLYDSICCNGRDCGCMGASHAAYLVHCLRELLATARGQS